MVPNPCPCGHAGNGALQCNCASGDVLRYVSRISGPLADRIDMHVTVAALPLSELSTLRNGHSSREIRIGVEAARALQRARFARMASATCNAHASGRWLDSNGMLSADARSLLNTAAEKFALSARGYHRVIKVARTIADLERSRSIAAPHLAEALRYRPIAPAHAPVALALPVY